MDAGSYTEADPIWSLIFASPAEHWWEVFVGMLPWRLPLPKDFSPVPFTDTYIYIVLRGPWSTL